MPLSYRHDGEKVKCVKMKAVYLIPNQSWVIVLGDEIIGVGVHNRRFFNTKRELVRELNKYGLRLDRNKVVLT